DPDGDDLTYRVTSGPDIGSLTNINADTGRFTYVPAAVGTDRFTFKANDGRLDSDNGTVSILVTAQAVASEVVGLRSVLPDPSSARGLIILWNSPTGIAQRISTSGTLPAQLLLRGVQRLAADPWQTGRLLAYMQDGRFLVSLDGGFDWQIAGRLAQPSDIDSLAVAGDRALIGMNTPACEIPVEATYFIAPDVDNRLLTDVKIVCGRQPVLDAMDGAYFVQNGWLRSATGGENLLGPGTLAAAVDPWLQNRLTALVREEAGRFVLRDSEDGGRHWRSTDRGGLALADQSATIQQLVFDPDRSGAMFVSVGSTDGATTVYRTGLQQIEWQAIGSLRDSAARLFFCGRGTLCLLSQDGTRLRRFSDTPIEGQAYGSY
ncbi:MAG: Ig-like domain-containing protein, partial [Gammaproteobacteria bacterium]